MNRHAYSVLVSLFTLLKMFRKRKHQVFASQHNYIMFVCISDLITDEFGKKKKKIIWKRNTHEKSLNKPLNTKNNNNNENNNHNNDSNNH